MGVVFEATDDRLGRHVAIKTILPTADAQMRERLVREARAAASVNHPHVCQLFEIGEHDGQPFLAMELLEGRSLGDRLQEGAIPPGEAIAIALSILSALGALHQRGIIHRDLKPSNVFLATHGVKLLDFGLARPMTIDLDTTSLTVPGVLIGTPRYMSPEQARGADVDARSDLFAVGAVLFEMLSGRPAFNGESAIDALHAVLHDQPPALIGSLAVVDADGVIQKALAKSAADRYQSAEEMAMDLRACLTRSDLSGATVARATRRLIVLPFRILRADPAIDFLAFSLPDAITVSLSGIESLVVRSSLAAARFGDAPADLRVLATEAGVDAVVTGSLLHANGVLRVSVQLVEAPSGTVLWSHAAQVPIDDLFQIQDSVCSAVVQALALPISKREQRLLRHDVPASSDAYAHYLQANRLSTSSSHWDIARDLYQQAVAADPSYAPAWARLGRCLRVLGKYGVAPDPERTVRDAEKAFSRAFELNPDLALTHHLVTHLEVDRGRALDAVIRLLGQVSQRTSDPDLYAGLVHACRYAGLLDASLAAYQRAKRLDPTIRTTVAHTYYMRGDYERAIEADADYPPYIGLLSLVSLGRTNEAMVVYQTSLARSDASPHLAVVLRALGSVLTNDAEGARGAIAELMQAPGFSDPEGWYYWAHSLAAANESDRALDLLDRAVDGGMHCVRALETPRMFDSLRLNPRFAGIVERARAAHAVAARKFVEADGPRILGLA
jgi:eukaryotic-like serine/threonine-protein kinase